MTIQNDNHRSSILDYHSYIFWYATWATQHRRVLDKRWRVPTRCIITPTALNFETLPSISIAEIATTEIATRKIYREGVFAVVIIQFHHTHPVFGQRCTLDIYPTTSNAPEAEAQAFVQVIEAFRQGEQPTVDPHPWRRSYTATHTIISERDLEPFDQRPYSHEPSEL